MWIWSGFGVLADISAACVPEIFGQKKISQRIWPVQLTSRTCALGPLPVAPSSGMRLLKPLRSDLWWPPDILRLQVLIQKVLLFALSLLAARSTLLSWTVQVSENIFAPLSGWTTHIGVRKMLRNFKFPISNYFVLVLACMALLQAVAGQFNPNDQMVWYGGPGQALAFYGTRTGLLLPIGLSNDEVDEVFTLEFWVQARCAHITCTFFTLQNLYNQECVPIVKAISAWKLVISKTIIF